MEWCDCKVKQIKQQRWVYCPEEKELSKEEYYHLIKTSQDLEHLMNRPSY